MSTFLRVELPTGAVFFFCWLKNVDRLVLPATLLNVTMPRWLSEQLLTVQSQNLPGLAGVDIEAERTKEL